jgi:ABC-2 type transport system permease protein
MAEGQALAAPLLPPASAPPSQWLWFARIQAAFLRAELAQLSRYRIHVLTRGLTFLLSVLSLYFFARFVGAAANRHLDRYGGGYLAFGLLGLITSDLQHVGVRTLDQRVRQAQLAGYLESELATPAPAWMVLAASPLYVFAAAVLRSAAYLVGASLLLGVRFQAAQPATVLLVVPFILLAFMGVGLLAAAGTMLTRRSNPLAAVLGAASMLLSGVVYPVSVLPAWLQSVGHLLPLTHALEALRLALLVGAPPRAIAPSLGALALFAFLSASGGLLLFAHALKRARMDGSLTHY